MILIRLGMVWSVLALLLLTASAAPAPQVDSPSYSKAHSAEDGEMVEPLPIRLINPVYPKKVKKKKMHGRIVLSATIGMDGAVKDVSVVSGDPAVIDAALKAVRRWRYLPAMRNGEFIETTQEVKLDYDFGKNASQPDEREPGTLSEPPQNLLEEISDAKLFRVGPGTGISPPRALSAPDPEYTDEARRLRFRGEILLCVVVGADGRPRNIWVARPLGHGLDRSAVETIRGWKFSPAEKDGIPVSAVVSVEMSFNLY
jgi:TonB family protein